MNQTISLLLAFAVANVAAGQQRAKDTVPKSPPVRVQRNPPARPVNQNGIPAPDKYPFDRLINTLDSGDPAVSPTSIGAVTALAPGSPASEVPKDFSPAKDVPLPPAAREALSVGQAWMTESHTPAPG